MKSLDNFIYRDKKFFAKTLVDFLIERILSIFQKQVIHRLPLKMKLEKEFICRFLLSSGKF